MCEICRQTPCSCRCPNYVPKSKIKCSVCGDEITNGEEYIVNDNDEYAHWECVDLARKLAEFLGYEIKEMEDDFY